MEKKDVVKCRFCDYELARRYRTKGGKFRMGAGMLLVHVEHEHPEEWARLVKWAAEECPEEVDL